MAVAVARTAVSCVCHSNSSILLSTNDFCCCVEMPPPSVAICEICGGKFSKHSLAIHQKACVKKREESTSFCPVCDQLVTNDEYSHHVEECKRVNAHVLREKKIAAAKAAKAKGANGGADGDAAGDKPSSASQKSRSKIPESVLRRLEAAKAGSKELSPEEQLFARLGEPCHACGGAMATTACVGCHTVYCAPCCDMIHEVNRALSDHKPINKEVGAHTQLDRRADAHESVVELVLSYLQHTIIGSSDLPLLICIGHFSA